MRCERLSADSACRRCSSSNLQCVYEFKIPTYKIVGSSSPREGDRKRTSYSIPHLLNPSIEGSINHKRLKLDSNFPLSIEQANELFAYFQQNISPQLFGFDISLYKVEDLRHHSPLLTCTICCIASIHSPHLSHLFPILKDTVDRLSSQVLFKLPATASEAFNTILALCINGFWLESSQNFTGLALQVAKSVGLNRPCRSKKEEKQRLRLWYLLYILDGQQSLTFFREPIVECKKIHQSGNLLLDSQNNSAEGTTSHANHSDFRLVSQVLHNQAIKEALSGDAWDILSPVSFGMPFKTNMELDKWMVRWTVLLAPFNHNGSVWSNKSALIYYNFAKMHLNSHAMKQLETQNQEKFDESDHQQPEDFSRQIAFSAAQNVLNLVLNDDDIIQALRYVPIHIHIMLYYAVMLLLDSPEGNTVKSLNIARSLQNTIARNKPTDRKFADQMVQSLNKLISEKSSSLKDSDKQLVEESSITNQSSAKKIRAWPGSDHGHP